MCFDYFSFSNRQKRQHKICLSVFCLCVLFMANNVFAEDEINTNENGALHGYDPVSFFSGKALPGRPIIASVFEGSEYHFATLKNKRLFENNPEHYLPMYGGYCAYGVRMGQKLDITPSAYEIRDDKLYLLLNRATHKIWLQDMAENIRISDNLWPQIESKAIKSLQ